MKTLLTKEELIAFEDDIADCFNNAMIRSPVHLEHGNEDQLIEIFKHVSEDDWVCCSWRSHYKCLLKGVPPAEVKQAILDNRSIEMCFAKYNVLSSAIVGGIVPIALGLAMDIRRRAGKEQVWCFVGDMTSMQGAFAEALSYAHFQKLPIKYIVEDNGKSVCTDTKETWNVDAIHSAPLHQHSEEVVDKTHSTVWYYKYKLDKYPHAGAGLRITF